jgi:cytochrome oxidase Cu insertion factor (SCO1/SenC/PrrC family)
MLQGLGVFVFVAVVAVTSGSRAGSAQTAKELKPFDPAPLFSLQGSDGRTYKLADFRGKQAVVLVWFVKAFSGG